MTEAPDDTTATATATPPKFPPPDVSQNINFWIAKRLELRSQKAKVEERHKEELANLNMALDLIDAGFINYFANQQSDTVTVRGVGTAYRKTRDYAKIDDPASFRRYVIGSDAYHLVDWRANAPAVREAIKEAGNEIPGVKFSSHLTVGFRKE